MDPYFGERSSTQFCLEWSWHIVLVVDLHEHPPDQGDERTDENGGEHGIEKMDEGDHLSPVMAVMAVAAPAAPTAPMATPSPEMAVVVVLVPSGAMVTVLVQDAKVKTTEARAKAREWRSFMVSFYARMFIEGAGIGIDDA